MKRMFGVLVTALATMVVTAGTALAQTTYPPTPTETTSVAGGGGSNTAFTGSDASLVAVIAVALLVVGLAALFVARRRSARAATV